MKKFFMRHKTYIAAFLCFIAAMSAGYMIQKNEIEKTGERADETQAFIAEGEEEEVAPEPEVRVLPEAFADDGVHEPPVTAEEVAPAAATATFSPVTPLSGPVIKGYSTSPLYSVTLDDWRSHEAVDIGASEGEEVYSIEKGTVAAVGRDPLLGVYVRIDHGNGIESVYANMHSETTVSEGQEIEAHHQIGYVGKTSISEQAEEEHLHFEIKKDGKRVDPTEYIKKFK